MTNDDCRAAAFHNPVISTDLTPSFRLTVLLMLQFAKQVYIWIYSRFISHGTPQKFKDKRFLSNPCFCHPLGNSKDAEVCFQISCPIRPESNLAINYCRDPREWRAYCFCINTFILLYVANGTNASRGNLD